MLLRENQRKPHLAEFVGTKNRPSPNPWRRSQFASATTSSEHERSQERRYPQW
jgi:hypothetical protein